MMETKRKRVLMVSCEGLGKGGVQSIMMGIIRALSKDYYFDMVLFTSEKRYYDDEFLKYGGKIFRIPHKETGNRILCILDSYTRDNRIYKEICKILSTEQPYDIIHCNKEFENAPILKAAYHYKIPIRISHSHIYHISCNPIKELVNKYRTFIIDRFATDCIGCSEYANETIHRSRKCRVINNFYDDERYMYSKLDGITSQRNLLSITQVGAISHNKNQLFSIKIANELRQMGVNVKLNLIGFNMQKDYRKIINSVIADKNLNEIISILPGDCNIPAELQKSCCFIMPSLYEGFGISLIEAQAMGLKCFASDSIPHSVDCGGITFLSLNKNEKFWADSIYRWFIETGGTKLHYDTSRFKTQTVIKDYKLLYERIQ